MPTVETLVVLWDGRGSPPTAPYENSYAWSMGMRDGKVVDGTAVDDTISFDELWDARRAPQLSSAGHASTLRPGRRRAAMSPLTCLRPSIGVKVFTLGGGVLRRRTRCVRCHA